MDTHPDTATTTDLRLLEPWPELLALVQEKTQNLDTLEDDEHGHVPYVLILLHYLERWKSTHDGKPPQNYKEKTEFRETVRSGSRTSAASGEEENFEEAVSAVLKSLNPSTPSSAVKEVFSADECQNLSSSVCCRLAPLSDRILTVVSTLVLRFLGNSTRCSRLLLLPLRPSTLRESSRHESQIGRLYPPAERV